MPITCHTSVTHSLAAGAPLAAFEPTLDRLEPMISHAKDKQYQGQAIPRISNADESNTIDKPGHMIDSAL